MTQPAYEADQVVRLERIRRDHPDAVIVCDHGYWTADWTSPDGGQCRTVHVVLKLVLDKVEQSLEGTS